MKNLISFRPLSFHDMQLMHHWFNLSHVQKFYSLRSWTENEVLNKLKPYIDGTQSINGFIILIDNKPIGYVQQYRVSDYPWPNQNLSEDILNNAAGMDIFIGEEKLIGKGIGTELIKAFIKEIITPVYQFCIVDPDNKNIAAIRCYEKLNFKFHTSINSEDALKRKVKLILMIFKC